MALSTSQFYRILKQHYLQGMTQREIAEREKLSTATVSRAVNEGIEKGLVKVTLQLPEQSCPDLESSIKKRFGLDFVYVTHNDLQDSEIIRNEVAHAAAKYLCSILNQGDIVGLSWGRTLSAIANAVPPMHMKKLTFVSMSGGVGRDLSTTGAEQVLHQFVNAFHAQGYSMPLPTMVNSTELAAALQKDEHIEQIYSLIEKANIALFSLGCVGKGSLLYNTGYLTEDVFTRMREDGFVGEVCAKYYRADGTHENDEFYNRTIGITLEQLREKERRICVVSDAEKVYALMGAINGGYINELFIDEYTAQALIKL